MHLRPLGRTGLRVSALGLGTVKLGRNRGVKYPHPFELPSDEDARRLLTLAADLGINLLDTAPAYGQSEERLGVLLEGLADRFLVSTKVGEEFDGERSVFDFSPEHTAASVRRSLTRLRREALDIVLVHSDGRDLDIVHRFGTLEALAECRRAGLVRAVGLSAKSAEGARAAMPHCNVLMLALNPADQEMLPVVREAHAAGVGVLIKKGLRSGRLGALAPPDADPVRAALGFLLAEPGVSSVVAGTIDPDHLRHNADAARAADPA
jgi:aryl-alcohol dehydrogenase-like predicted oxidoreductase